MGEKGICSGQLESLQFGGKQNVCVGHKTRRGRVQQGRAGVGRGDLLHKPDQLSFIPRIQVKGRRQEMTPKSCLLTSTRMRQAHNGNK